MCATMWVRTDENLTDTKEFFLVCGNGSDCA
jgi:hypothetical protein